MTIFTRRADQQAGGGHTARLLACFLLAAGLAGCSKDQPPKGVETEEAHGSITVAVGDNVREFDLAEARCESVEAGGEDFLHVVAPGTKTYGGANPIQPHLLVARLPQDLGPEEVVFGPDQPNYSATASVIGASYEGTEYKLLEVHFARANGGPKDYECRASLDGQDVEVVCNEGKVFPWMAPGRAPVGSFKATVTCR